MDKDDDKVFDIAKPGSGGPSATSRPIIVGHGNMIEDPMMTASASATLDNSKKDEDTTDPAKLKKEEETGVGPHQAKTIEPPPGAQHEPTPSAAPAAVPPAEPQPESAASDSLPDEPKAPPKDAKVDEEELAQQAAIQKLIESKQYVVHIGEVNHRHPGQHKKIAIRIIIGLAVLAALVFLEMQVV
jgi:hypothetical protein